MVSTNFTISSLEVLQSVVLEFDLSIAFVVYPNAHFNRIALTTQMAIPLDWEMLESPFYVEIPEESRLVDSNFVNPEENFMSIDEVVSRRDYTFYILYFQFLSNAICDKLSNYGFNISGRDSYGNNATLRYGVVLSHGSACYAPTLWCPSQSLVVQVPLQVYNEKWVDPDAEDCVCETPARNGMARKCLRPWPHVDLIHHYIYPLFREINVLIHRTIEFQISNIEQLIIATSLQLQNGTYLWKMDESYPFALVPPHIGSFSESSDAVEYWSRYGFRKQINIRLFSNLSLDLTQAVLTFDLLYLRPYGFYATVRNKRCDAFMGAIQLPLVHVFSLETIAIQCDVTCAVEIQCTAYQIVGNRCELFFRCDELALVEERDSLVRFKKYSFLYEENGTLTLPTQTFHPSRAPSKGPDPHCVSLYLSSGIGASPRSHAIEIIEDVPSLFECMNYCCMDDLLCASFIWSGHDAYRTCYLFSSHFDVQARSTISTHGWLRNYTWYRKSGQDSGLYDNKTSSNNLETLILQVWAATIIIIFPVLAYYAASSCILSYRLGRNLEDLVFEESESIERGANSEQLNEINNLFTVTYSEKKKAACKKCFDAEAVEKRAPFQATIQKDSIDYDAMCVICSDAFVENEKITVLPCNHKFHMLCLMQWLRLRSTCPLCRLDIKYIE